MLDLLEGVPLTGVDRDALRAACTQVRNYCGWHIAPSITETITVPVRNGVGRLPSKHVTAVTGITGAGVDMPFSWAAGGRFQLSNSRYCGPVTVTLTHGYPECPADVRAVVARLAAGGTAGEIVRAQIGQVSVGLSTPLASLSDLDFYQTTGIA
jgi:hypothetical protein